MRATRFLRVLVLALFVLTGTGWSPGLLLASTPQAESAFATPTTEELYATPEGAPPAIPGDRDVDSCEWEECNGAYPDVAGCIDDLNLVERQQEVIVGNHVATLHLVGAYPQSRCGSVQWARADPEGLQDFALRVVQCDTGLATEWEEFENREAPAWSPMVSSEQLCVWAEYGVPDKNSPDGYRVVERTKPE